MSDHILIEARLTVVCRWRSAQEDEESEKCAEDE